MIPLITALAKVSDFRKSKGRRHPLAVILGLACGTALGGVCSLTAIRQWAREHNSAALLTWALATFRGRV